MTNNTRNDPPSTLPPLTNSSSSSITDWFRLAAHPATVRRALVTALIVGVILIAINHGAAIISGQVTRARIFQMCLTVLVPYIVSTVSSVSTRRELRADQKTSEQMPRKRA